MGKSSNQAVARLYGALNSGTVGETFIRALRKALNAQDRRNAGLSVSSSAPGYDPQLILEQVYDRTPRIDDVQAAKGLAWLMDQWKTPKGKPRKGNPFGWTEQQILSDFSHFTLTGFIGNENFPVYRVHAKGGLSFSYHAMPWQQIAYSRSGERVPSIHIC